jgi:hypothetical protein
MFRDFFVLWQIAIGNAQHESLFEGFFRIWEHANSTIINQDLILHLQRLFWQINAQLFENSGYNIIFVEYFLKK